MTSYLHYLFSSPVNTHTNNAYSTIKSEYIADFDKNYDSIRFDINDLNTTLSLSIDIAKSNPTHVISILNNISDNLEMNETKTIECDGDSYCFFRQPFQILQDKDSDYIVISSIQYNRCSATFSTKVDKKQFINELKYMIEKL